MIEKVMNHRNGNGNVYKAAPPLLQPSEIPRPYAKVNDDSIEEGGAAVSELLPEDGSCPECGSKVEHEGGCVVCRNCGYSKCG